jgi:hypothetical protein
MTINKRQVKDVVYIIKNFGGWGYEERVSLRDNHAFLNELMFLFTWLDSEDAKGSDANTIYSKYKDFLEKELYDTR